MPKVSVIIPVYNVEEYIRECLESVVNQTLKDIEIIVVNDGTKDQSIEKIKDIILNDIRIKLINKENGGLSSARNAGIINASGEYLLFLDSDDYLTLDALEELYAFAKTNELDQLFFNADSFFEQDAEEDNANYKSYYKRNGKYDSIMSGQRLFIKFDENKDYKPSACLQLLKTDFILNKNIFFYEGILHEDNLFTLQCLLNAERATFLNKSFYKRRVHLNSIMTTPKGIRNSYGYFITVFEMLKRLGEYDGAVEKQFEITLEKQLKSLLHSARKYIEDISIEEINEYIDYLDLDKRIAYKFLVLEFNQKQVIAKLVHKLDNKKVEEKNSVEQHDTNEMVVSEMKQNSKFDATINIITFIPRKIVGGIRCYQEHGLEYTIERIKYKIKKLLKKIDCRRLSNLKTMSLKAPLRKKEPKNDELAISVIIPVYNVEKFLPECLDSILNQTYQNFEIICVDDGSTDKSWNILQQYAKKDDRVKVYRQENKYAGVARNHGLQYAKGEYVLFLDSDDFIERNMLEKIYMQSKKEQADICLFGARKFDNVTKQYTNMSWILRKEYMPEKIPFSAKDCADYIYALTSPCPWSKLFRRDFILENRLEFMPLKRTNDLFFVEAALSIAEKITYCNGYYVNYRSNIGTNLQSNNQETMLDFYTALLQLKSYLIEKNLYENFLVAYKNLALSTCIYNLESIKNLEKKSELQNILRKEISVALDIGDLKEKEILSYNRENYTKFKKYLCQIEIKKVKQIKFTDFKKCNGRIDFKCIIEMDSLIEEKLIYFELEPEAQPSNDAIALAISTFVGEKFEQVSIDLPISKETKDNIEKFTKAVVIAPVDKNTVLKPITGDNIILNFSGGFDSLAAMYLMPSRTKLVAIDFGGWFEREAKFFRKFQPYILKTNFRQLKMDRNSWTFMGVGAILYSEYLDAGYNVFGTILEGSAMHFKNATHVANNNTTAPFCYMGLKDIRYMNGLTEVGTAMIVSYYAPEMINESLESLSNPKTEKRYRKEILMEIICKKFNRQIKFNRTPIPHNKTVFGENIALDFLCLYILKNAGMKEAMATMQEIPSEVEGFVSALNLTFYERINPEFVAGNTFINSVEKGEFMKRLLSAGVIPYTENDFIEYRKVVEFLNKYHHFNV